MAVVIFRVRISRLSRSSLSTCHQPKAVYVLISASKALETLKETLADLRGASRDFVESMQELGKALYCKPPAVTS